MCLILIAKVGSQKCSNLGSRNQADVAGRLAKPLALECKIRSNCGLTKKFNVVVCLCGLRQLS